MEYIILSTTYFNNAVKIKNRIYVLKEQLESADREGSLDIMRRIEILKSMYYEAVSIGRLLKEKGENILCQEGKN